jgi:glucose-6-phosphate dehydrogenase assembly protein OpcA
VLEGRASNLIPNIVFSNLDSDLPLILWWQGEFPQPIDGQLWAWVDRLVFDSQKWSNPAEQFTRLLDSLEKIQSRLALCDLNWTRSLHLRQALAQMFDHPENRSILERLTVVKISYAADFRLTALLLVGWFAAQLRLELVRHEGERIFLRKSDGSEVSFQLAEEEGRSISRSYVCSGDAAVEVTRVGNGDFFHVEVQLPEGRTFRHLLPAGSNQSPSLLAEELALGGRHRVYLKALAVAKALL